MAGCLLLWLWAGLVSLGSGFKVLEQSNLTVSEVLRLPAGRRLLVHLRKDPEAVQRAAKDLGIILTEPHERLLSTMKHSARGTSLLQEAGTKKGTTKSGRMAQAISAAGLETEELQAECEAVAVDQLTRLLTGEELLSFDEMASRMAEPAKKAVFDSIVGIIGAANPFAGMMASMGMGVLWGILGDPFGLQQEDPMEALYKKIMEEVKELIDENAMKRDLEEHRAEMTALLQEMDWFPEVLQQVGTGATQGLESHTAVLWHIMVQQHIALLTGKLWSAPCLTNVYSDSCRSWQQKPGVLELALKLAGIQQQELLEIARLEPSYRDGLDKRMLQVIQSHYRQASAAFQVYVHARLHNYVHDGRDDFPGATSLGNGHDNQKKIFDKTHRSLRSHISKWAALLGAAEGATNSFYTSQSVDDPPVVSLNPRNHENWRIHTTEQPNGVLRVITGLFIWLGGDVGFHTVTFLSQDLVRAHQAKVQTIDHAGDHSHWKRCPVGTFMRAMYSPLGSNRRRHDPWTHWDKTECVEIPVTPTPLSEDRTRQCF